MFFFFNFFFYLYFTFFIFIFLKGEPLLGYIPHTDFGLNHASHASQKKKTEEKHNVF